MEFDLQFRDGRHTVHVMSTHAITPRPCCRHGWLFSGTYCPVVCTIGKLIKGEYKYEAPLSYAHINLIINQFTYIVYYYNSNFTKIYMHI